MSAPVFKAAFCDVKPIKTRQMVQFIFEVPVTEADEAMKVLGGFPNPAVEVWAGIARIDPKKAAHPSPIQSDEPKARVPFRTLPLAQQAALKCGDEAFRRFICEEFAEQWTRCESDKDAADFIRWYCGVDSRSELKLGTEPGSAWRRLLDKFDVWMSAAAA